MPMEKTFDAAEAETRLYKMWEEAGAFKAGANASRDETFTIMLPPPNVTGHLHVGHAFQHTLMDILIRWKRMQGYDTLWQPGLDHAGIAVQLMVPDTEKPGNFHDAVIKVFVEMYNKGLIYRGKRLVNWDPHFETAISDLEVENIEVDGHMWHFKYPLAGGETYEYVEKDEDGNVTLRETRDYISIATTRPETMLGDGAVAVHKDDERYAPIVSKLCEIPVGPKEQRRLIPIITDPYPDMNFGSGAVKITGAHDFNDYEVAKRGNIPMYSLMDTKGHMRSDGAPYVEEAATAQRIANGEEDFDESKIAAMNLVPEEYRGLDRFEARKRVIDDITADGNAVMHDMTRTEKDEDGNKVEVTETVPFVENKKIMQPFGDRSKVVIEPMLTDQWFVDAEKVVGPALDAVKEGRTKIVPESGEKVYYHWLENIEPWCISRQLWWGHQIPIWYGLAVSETSPELQSEGHGRVSIDVYQHVETGQPAWEERFCAISEDEARRMAEAYANERIPKHFKKVSVFESYAEANSFAHKNPDHFCIYRDPDVLDTWFSSGLWPFGTLGWPEETDELAKYFPGDVLVTGQDILFFWVARMMMMSEAVMDDIPFHTVYLHQLVRDEKGRKMSKTTGNVIDPLDMISAYGADALRFSNAQMAAMGGVLKISEDRIKGYRNFGTKLWNACRFAEMNEVFNHRANLPDASPTQVRRKSDAQFTVNKWIVGETAKTLAVVNDALETYRFNDAANALYSFVWGKVCDWYVESCPSSQKSCGKHWVTAIRCSSTPIGPRIKPLIWLMN